MAATTPCSKDDVSGSFESGRQSFFLRDVSFTHFTARPERRPSATRISSQHPNRGTSLLEQPGNQESRASCTPNDQNSLIVDHSEANAPGDAESTVSGTTMASTTNHSTIRACPTTPPTTVRPPLKPSRRTPAWSGGPSRSYRWRQPTLTRSQRPA